MKPLKIRLQEKTTETKSRFDIVEKDYALSYILAGIVSVDELKQTLVFKGGTALKKCYFGEYRFSEDLDFSTIAAPQGEAIEGPLQQALENAAALLSEHGDFTLTMKRHLEKDPHPGGQDAFDIHVKYPWHPRAMCHLKIEITHDEPVLLKPEIRPLIHGYDEAFSYAIGCYPLEEVVSEKLRSMLQTRQRLLTRASKRPRARDYYDLWRIFSAYSVSLNKVMIKELLPRKCEHREVTYTHLEEFFTPELLVEVERHWEKQLGHYVQNLPSYNALLTELQGMVAELLA